MSEEAPCDNWRRVSTRKGTSELTAMKSNFAAEAFVAAVYRGK